MIEESILKINSSALFLKNLIAFKYEKLECFI
jgi:hypothetical protein